MHTRRVVRELRDKVDKYWAMARMTTDPETAGRILELTDELEQHARDIERGNKAASVGGLVCLSDVQADRY